MYMKKSKESTKMLPELIFLSISNKLLEIGFLKKKIPFSSASKMWILRGKSENIYAELVHRKVQNDA